ncbi:MAG: beta-ketoacyl-[acyl-carrier-protein] synthase family protein [Kiritimatiellae bacterium]|nr:beta-ketoacyl-[acyl-carrier-protein] synthase family protein [Kiritimatiellia bacterium]
MPTQWRDSASRTLGFAFTAVEEALIQANIDSSTSLRVGVCLGTTVASQLNDLAFYTELKKTGSASMDAVKRYLAGNLAEAVAEHYGFTGPALSVVNACSSGSDAMGIGMSWLRAGYCDVVIAGGADELNLVSLSGFNALNVYDEGLCKPFDKNRTGLNLGEGSGVVVLEREEDAVNRGKDIRLTCVGYGSFADAYHITAPRPDGSGLEHAINAALKSAGITASDIAFVNAHGTATPNNDLIEGNTIARMFGEDVLVYSTKGYTGHTLGAAGGLEAVFIALGLREGWMPASAGFEEQDDAIALTPVKEKTSISGKYALSTSLAFGGINTALIIGRR